MVKEAVKSKGKIEEVARALARNSNRYHFDRGDSDAGWEENIDAAREAIEAMREPTDAMVDVGWDAPDHPAVVFSAMIDAALNEPAK